MVINANDNWQNYAARSQTGHSPHSPHTDTALDSASHHHHTHITQEHIEQVNKRLENRAKELESNIPNGFPMKTYKSVLNYFTGEIKLTDQDIGKTTEQTTRRVAAQAKNIQDTLPAQAQAVAKMNPGISSAEAEKMADFFAVILEDLSNHVQQSVPEVTGEKTKHISSLTGNVKAQQLAEKTLMDHAFIVEFTLNTDGMGAISPDILKNTFGKLQDRYPHSLKDFEYNIDSKSYKFVIPNAEMKDKILYEMSKANLEDPVWKAINIKKILPYKDHKQQMEKQTPEQVAQR